PGASVTFCGLITKEKYVDKLDNAITITVFAREKSFATSDSGHDNGH
ncbi:2494_t:CDS:1, partial [Ambispora leptoticha]